MRRLVVRTFWSGVIVCGRTEIVEPRRIGIPSSPTVESEKYHDQMSGPNKSCDGAAVAKVIKSPDIAVLRLMPRVNEVFDPVSTYRCSRDLPFRQSNCS